MRTLIRSAATIGAFAAGLLVVPAAANAAPPVCHHVHQAGGNNYGLLNGTQIYSPFDLALNVTGNALGLLGSATATDNSQVHCR